MNKRFVTIVSNEKGGFSLHTSWKSACLAYGWKYEKSIPIFREGHSIRKAPLDVTIKCLELVEFIHRKDIVQSYLRQEGEWVFSIAGYDTEYLVYCDYNTQLEDADYHHGDRGAEMISNAFEYYNLTEVLKVELITEDSVVEIPVDKWTGSQILDNLDFSENVE